MEFGLKPQRNLKGDAVRQEWQPDADWTFVGVWYNAACVQNSPLTLVWSTGSENRLQATGGDVPPIKDRRRPGQVRPNCGAEEER